MTGIADAVQVAVGWTQACAVRASGTVACWGENDFGQLGDGVATHSTCSPFGTPHDCALTPVTVSGLTDAVEVSLQNDTACARRATGDVVCWGDGYYLRTGASPTA